LVLKLAYVDEAGTLRREDGATVPATLEPTSRVEIAGATTWVHTAGVATSYIGGAATSRVPATVFAAGLGGAYAASGDWLTDASTGARMGQVIAATTSLFVGDRFGVGFYRAGKLTVGFVVSPRRGMLQVPLAPIDGRVVETNAAFDGERALLGVAVDHGGKRTHLFYLLDERGKVLAHAAGAPDDGPFLASVFGKCMSGGAIAAATDDGLVLHRLDAPTETIEEAKTFPATRDLLSAGVDILVGPQGSIFLVHPGEVLQLSL
jgi:hypothetical protein